MKQFFFTILFSLIGVYAQAQQSLLWKIQSPQNASPSYIIAIVQAPGVETFDIAASTDALFDKIQAVAFTNLPTESEQQDIYTIMHEPGENTLKRYFKREDQIRFELMIKEKLNAEPDYYYATKPLFIYQLFRNYDYGNSKNYLQNILFTKALEKTKPVLSLLTLRQEAAMMDGIDYALQAGVVSNYVTRTNEFLQGDLNMFQAYFNQDINAIQNNYTVLNSAGLNSYNNLLNIELAKKIHTISDGQATLYIINAENLVGETGILELLKKDGLQVTADHFVFIQKTAGAENMQVTTATESTQSDNFPMLQTSEKTASASVNDIVVKNIADTSNVFHRVYKDLEDPFGDLLDYNASDTSFLEKWYSLKASEGNFRMKIPERKEWTQNTTQSLGQTINSYSLELNDGKSDLFYSVGYTVYPHDFDAGDKARFFSEFITRQINKLQGELVGQRIISTPEYTGREFTLIIDDSFFVHSKIILRNNILYQLLTGGPADNAYSKYASAFFNSFTIEGNKTNTWYALEQGSFFCNLPTPPGKTTQTYNTQYGPLTVQTFSAEDYRESISYFISVNSYPPGYKFKSDNTFYKELVSGAERTYVGRVVDEQKIKKNGATGRYVTMQLNNGKQYKIYFFFINNTVYEYLAGGDPLSMLSPNVQYFFDTFKLNEEK